MLATNPTLRDQKIHKNLLKDGSRDALRSVLSTQPLSYIQDGKSFLSLHVLYAAERPKAFPPRWAAGPRELRPSLSPTGVAGPTQRPDRHILTPICPARDLPGDNNFSARLRLCLSQIQT